jgi:predicted kinase
MMTNLILLSGPIGAGKTTIAKELVKLTPRPTAYLEGDRWWPFFDEGANTFSKQRNFRLAMSSMIAASLPLLRGGYDVILDFTIPPSDLDLVRKIVGDREVTLHYVCVMPNLETCALRARERAEGKIPDYSDHEEFFQAFQASPTRAIASQTPAAETAAEISTLIEGGELRI